MSDINRFEDQLRESLRRVEAPAGLEQRILARVEAKRRFVVRRWLAAAASVVVVAGASFTIHMRQQSIEQQRKAQAEAVRQQFEVALQVTSRQLYKADRQLRAIGVQNIEIREVAQ